jgi:hypothetical protein
MTSVILSPGGGNKDLWVAPEEVEVANWLNSLGVSCFVHRYRIQPYGSATDALAETQRAVRLVRANATDFGVDPAKIGHMVFSAGVLDFGGRPVTRFHGPRVSSTLSCRCYARISRTTWP